MCFYEWLLVIFIYLYVLNFWRFYSYIFLYIYACVHVSFYYLFFICLICFLGYIDTDIIIFYTYNFLLQMQFDLEMYDFRFFVQFFIHWSTFFFFTVL